MIWKTITTLHRYLGVTVGMIMLIWCLSGFVMMYQGFPETTDTENRLARQVLLSDQCCVWPDDMAAEQPVSQFEIRMRAGQPVIDVSRGRLSGIYSLETGERVAALTRHQARNIASQFLHANGVEGDIASFAPIEVDQWTVYMWRREAPLWKADIDDASDTYVYVSGQSGQVVQDANRQERLLAWLGAIPHWLYPQLLRQNQPVWYQSVIWLSVLGIFLTLTGLVVGLRRLRTKSGKWFPFKKPFWLWHHISGVLAGILVLSWVASGLLTMQPWGLLETDPSTPRQAVSGEMTWGEVAELLDAFKEDAPAGIVGITAAPFAGEPALRVQLSDGSAYRFGHSGRVELSPDDAHRLLEEAGLAVLEVSLLTSEDAYYYGHKTEVGFPIVRVRLDDADRTRVYVDPETGEIVRFVTATARRFRWLENGFHNFDWPGVQERPIWDVVTLLLLMAVTLVCGTGAWLSISRVRRDIRMGLRRLKGSKQRRARTVRRT